MVKTQKLRRKRRIFDNQYKEEAVRLCKVGDRSVAKVAEALDLSHSVLLGWVKQAEASAAKGSPGILSTAESDELARLRRENKRLLMEREILRKAATFFAKEST